MFLFVFIPFFLHVTDPDGWGRAEIVVGALQKKNPPLPASSQATADGENLLSY